MGVKKPRSVLQVDELDLETRTSIWNYVFQLKEILEREDYKKDSDHARRVGRRLWSAHFSLPLDEYSSATAWAYIRNRVMQGEVTDALWLIEDFVDDFREVKDKKTAIVLAGVFNNIFERNLVGFRFLDLLIVPVTSSDEVKSVEEALASTTEMPGAQKHLQNAIALLSSKTNPQYAKSLSESISAVEAIVRHVSGANTLGAGLIELKTKGYPIHPALLDGWKKIYGYTSDGDGIRHGSVDPSDVDEAMATYFLVTCSAFVGLLRKAEMKIDAAS